MIPPSESTESRKVTIEDLLRLKRAEQPSPEFWNRFEQDLRAKQLAAIIEKRPWWVSLRLPQAARAVARFQVPVAAAAVLALSLVAVREYRGSASLPVAVEPALQVATPSPAIALVEQPARSVVIAQPRVVREVVSNTEAVAPVVSTQAGELMAMIPWAASKPAVSADAKTATVIGELPQVHFASMVNPGRDHDFAGRVELEPIAIMGVSAAADESAPAARVSPVSPREVRRNRILSTLVVADNTSEAEPSRLAQVREALVGSLDEDRLYDSVRRVGMVGDRLTLKF